MLTSFVISSFYKNFSVSIKTDQIISLCFTEKQADSDTDCSFLIDIRLQLTEYFLHKRKSFNLNYSIKGSAFKLAVLKEVAMIPYGQTVTYKEIAVRSGYPNAVRAVANAVASNPVLLIIPCHRVILSNGQIGGYSGGIETKKYLLNHEKSI